MTRPMIVPPTSAELTLEALRAALAALCAEREAKDGLIPARRVRALLGGSS